MNIFRNFFKNKQNRSEDNFDSSKEQSEILNAGLFSSAKKLNNLTSLFTQAKLSEENLERFSDLLLSCDFGLQATNWIIEEIRNQRFDKNLSEKELKLILRDKIVQILDSSTKDLFINTQDNPYIILFVGVNGSGKTTTIAKLAAKLIKEGKKPLLVAGDTFRAAAKEQLELWSKRLNCPIFYEENNNDAASVIFKAFAYAKQENRDVMLIDTAGRLQNNYQLMAELQKIIRVLGKINANAPHDIIQILDGNIGQNAISQVENFQKIAKVNGLIMTKLDGTAKGGILIALSQKFALPIYYIGLGEQIDDLIKFNAKDFANAICNIKQE